MFRLSAVVRDDGTNVKASSIARIQHILTETWIHGEKNVEVLRTDRRQNTAALATSEFSNKVAAIEWDRARLLKVCDQAMQLQLNNMLCMM